MSKWIDGHPGWVICWKCGGGGWVWVATKEGKLTSCRCPDCDGSPRRRKTGEQSANLSSERGRV